MAKLPIFEEKIQEATRDYQPHVLCTYLYDLAGIFNKFYEVNYNYTYNDGQILIEESDHMEEFSLPKQFQKIRKEYILSNFQELNKITNPGQPLYINEDGHDWEIVYG